MDYGLGLSIGLIVGILLGALGALGLRRGK